MHKRTALITTGLMLNLGLGSAVFAQYAPYRNGRVYSQSSYASSGQARRMVAQAYRDILRREPDASGLQAYTSKVMYEGWSEADVRRALLNSQEYAENVGSRYGRVRNNGYYNGRYYNNGRYGNGNYAQASSMVRRAYRSVLGREPDAAGLQAYTDKVVREGWSEQDLVRALRSSDEYRYRR